MRHTPALQELDISDCEQLSDRSLMAIASHCPQLQRIAISRCHYVTSCGIEKIAAMPKLTTLDFFGCYPEAYEQLVVSRVVEKRAGWAEKQTVVIE